MLVISWNVNSINARLEDVELLLALNPDIILLQEIKCEKNKFPMDFFQQSGYYSYINGQKSYHGVAILSKYELTDVVDNFVLFNHNNSIAASHAMYANNGKNNTVVKDDLYRSHQEARYIQGKLTISSGEEYHFGSIYVPNGKSVKLDDYLHKIEFINQLAVYARDFEDKNLILGGDFNIAPDDLDVFSVEKMTNVLSFTTPERKALNRVLSFLDDSFRVLNPFIQEFSWWDYRHMGLIKNRGLRIDLILTSPNITHRLTSANLHKSFRITKRPSDHIPCSIEFDI